MLIKNLTKNENIVLVSLKEKKEDQDVVLHPGQMMDLDSLHISDEKVNRSNELKLMIRAKKIKVFDLSDTNNQSQVQSVPPVSTQKVEQDQTAEPFQVQRKRDFLGPVDQEVEEDNETETAIQDDSAPNEESSEGHSYEIVEETPVDSEEKIKEPINDGPEKLTQEQYEEEMRKMNQEGAQRKKQEQIDRIQTTSVLTELEDIISNTDDNDLFKEAQKRMIELTGDGSEENPELKGRENPPMI